MFLEKIFPHKHNFEYVKGVTHPSEVNPFSAAPQTAKIYRCKCGEEIRKLTDAGKQQVYEWGDDVDNVLGLKGKYKTD